MEDAGVCLDVDYSDLIPRNDNRRRAVTVPFKHIFRAVCEEFTVTQIEIVSRYRGHSASRPRWVMCWLCRELTTNSFAVIGRILGNRDHSTIQHACKKMDEEIVARTDLGKTALRLKTELENGL